MMFYFIFFILSPVESRTMHNKNIFTQTRWRIPMENDRKRISLHTWVKRHVAQKSKHYLRVCIGIWLRLKLCNIRWLCVSLCVCFFFGWCHLNVSNGDDRGIICQWKSSRCFFFLWVCEYKTSEWLALLFVYYFGYVLCVYMWKISWYAWCCFVVSALQTYSNKKCNDKYRKKETMK